MNINDNEWCKKHGVKIVNQRLERGEDGKWKLVAEIQLILPSGLFIDADLMGDKGEPAEVPREKARDFNHTAIINTPIGGECVLIINGERQRWRVVKNFTGENHWCGKLCPFAGTSYDAQCPGFDNGCSLSSNYHKSGRDVMLKRVGDVEASDGNN